MALCTGQSKKSTFIIAQTHTAVFRLLWATVMSGLCSEHVLPSHLQRSWHHHQTFMREVERAWRTVWTQGYKMSSQRLMRLICMHPKLLMFMWDAVQEVDWSALSATKIQVSLERSSINLTGLNKNPIPKNWGLYKPKSVNIWIRWKRWSAMISSLSFQRFYSSDAWSMEKRHYSVCVTVRQRCIWPTMSLLPLVTYFVQQ